jgi:hypothetical protein
VAADPRWDRHVPAGVYEALDAPVVALGISAGHVSDGLAGNLDPDR